MIESMTGYGRGTAGKGFCRWTVEIRSLNHRFFDFSARLPNAFSAFEAEVQKLVQSCLKRGKIILSASLSDERPLSERLILDEEKSDIYFKTLKKIARRYGLRDHIELKDFIALPNLFSVEKKDASSRYWSGLKKAVEEALAKLRAMRLAEGRQLVRDFVKRADIIRKGLEEIEKLSEGQAASYKDMLQKRIKALQAGSEADEDRIAREVVFFADRSDVTEELVRAKHHVGSFVSFLSAKGETGKKLDFVLQELQREVNTIASKAQNVAVSNKVIQIKSELEKVREQLQNIV